MSFVTKTAIEGFVILEPECRFDERGVFQESFYQKEIYEHLGVEFNAVQQNLSLSQYGVVRGIHSYATVPQQKYVSVIKGKILDIVVDLRPDSRTYMHASGVFLDDAFGRKVIIAPGLGHCFVSMEDNTLVSYLVDQPHNPNHEKTLNPGQLVSTLSSFHQVDANSLIISAKDSAAEELKPRSLTLERP